jgi:hypothetical protein
MKASVTTAATAATPTAAAVTGAVGSVTAGVTVTTNNDKTGYALSSAGIQAIWDALTSALTTVGSIGKLLVDNINAAIGSASTHSAADVWAVATRVLTANTNLNDPTPAAIRTEMDSNSTQLAAIVEDTNITVPGLIAALNDPTTAAIVAAIMAEDLESGKTFKQAVLELWAMNIGDAAADDATNPTSITYDSPDGTVQVTHAHTSTTRTVS